MKVKGRWSLLVALICTLILVASKIQREHITIERDWKPPLVVEMHENIPHRVNAQCKTTTVDSLPQGIIQATSDLELRPLWRKWTKPSSQPKSQEALVKSNALLAVPVGLKQKKNVDEMVKKFFSANCSVMLFHYDGNVDAWNDLAWSSKAIHILAYNQTKWWFAKRFLHPDIVAYYDYIFLWDEDLGVRHFNPGRFLQIIVSEGLEISQPALDPVHSEVHHRITARLKKNQVHRRVYAVQGSLNCSENSTGPPCTGWIEGMAPVFSREAWRCVWHLIQNDLIHGWGLDMKLGYCAQGDRTEKVGVVDSEFIVHHGIPSLGGISENKAPSDKKRRSDKNTPSDKYFDQRVNIRRQSTQELEIFKKRWEKAVREDDDWEDPFDK